MRQLLVIAGVCVLLDLLLACKRDVIDVDAINTLVPAKHAYKLRFESHEITAGLKHVTHYTVAVPKGWTVERGSIKPTDSKAFGSSWMALRSSCEECRFGWEDDLTCDNNNCEPQDWGQVIDARVARDRERGVQYLRYDVEIGRRVLVVPGHTGGMLVAVYWWAKDGAVYHYCAAGLDEHLTESASAFVKACELAVAH